MADLEFTDNSIAVKNALEEVAIAFLHEAGGEMTSATQRHCRVDTGQTKGAWTYEVDESSLTATVGNPLENAIWEEFGTGEYALNGNGRKGGWSYKDRNGKWVHTKGKQPARSLHKAYHATKGKIIKAAKEKFKGVG